MKRTVLAFLLSSITMSLFAQADHVKWTYSARKKSANVYEVVLSAKLDPTWHIYSQSTPSGGPRPTVVVFKKNPLTTLDGKVKEIGDLKKTHDPNFGVDVLSYGDHVDFVQTVKLKGSIKTNISGTVEYMICDDSQCLPPTKKEFDIKLQ